MPPGDPATFDDERRAGQACRAAGDHTGALAHFLSAASIDPADCWNRHDVAVALKDLGRLDEAEAAYRAVAAGTPIAHSLRGLGFVQRAKGEREQALACFRSACLLLPDDAWFALDVAVELRALKRPIEADAALAALVAVHPSFVAAYRERAGLASERGDHAAAFFHAEAAMALAPEDASLARELAETAIRLRRLDEAEAIFLGLLVRRLDHVEALTGLARIARRRGEVEIAVAHLRSAAAARPHDADILTELSAELIAIGRIGDAEKTAHAALAIAPRNYRAKRCLALAAKTDGRMAQALALGWETFRTDGDNSRAGFDLAGDLREAGRFDLAERLYEILSARPDVAVEALIELGICRRRSQGFEAASVAYRRALALDPKNPRALLALGDDRRESGDLGGADAHYDAALDARPGFYWALVGKGIAALRRSDPAAAGDWFGQAIAADPDEGYAQILLASDLAESGDVDGARCLIAGVPAKSPRAIEAAMMEGRIHRLSGDFASAAAAFADVARRHPGHVEARLQQAEDAMRIGDGATAAEILSDLKRTARAHPSVLEALARRAMIYDDLDEALRFYDAAAAGDPLRLSAVLGQSRVLAMRGDVALAFAALDGAERRFGRRAEIAAARADLLRQTGELIAARAALDAACAAFPHHAGLRQQAIVADIDARDFDAAESAIADLPALRLQDRGRADFARSLLAAARWDFSTAIAAGEAAVAALPGDGWVRNRLIHAALLDLDLDRAEHHLRRLADMEASANRLRGKSANMSQSHYGQIFDEFRLDADALAALHAARALPDGQRVTALLSVVGAFADSTAAAISVFVEMRRSGRLSAPAPQPSGRGTIPRRIHQYWDDAAIPCDIAAYMTTWTVAHPDFSHHVWCEAKARAFLARSGDAATLAAFDRAAEPAMKADLFRLAMLFAVGGVYADADDRCMASIAPLVDCGRDLVLYQEDLGSLGNNFIAARARHPVIGRALALATAAVNRGDGDILWLSTGPGLLTRAAAQVVAERPEMLDAILVIDRHELLGYAAIHCLAGYKATERHWSRTAFGRTRRVPVAQATIARSA